MNTINTILHYAPIILEEDIPQYEFDEMDELLGFILAEASYEVVHLVCIDNNIFVSHEIDKIGRFIQSYKDYLQDVDVYWQEYKSYESAYKVSLDMQETSVFCYN